MGKQMPSFSVQALAHAGMTAENEKALKTTLVHLFYIEACNDSVKV